MAGTDYDYKAMDEVVAFDFDGVVHRNGKPWKGVAVIEDVPNPGIPELFRKLKAAGYQVVIHTCRALTPEGRRAVVHWLTANHMIELIDNVTAVKPIARCYVDDRAIRFEGCEGLLNAIEQFGKGE